MTVTGTSHFLLVSRKPNNYWRKVEEKYVKKSKGYATVAAVQALALYQLQRFVPWFLEMADLLYWQVVSAHSTDWKRPGDYYFLPVLKKKRRKNYNWCT